MNSETLATGALAGVAFFVLWLLSVAVRAVWRAFKLVINRASLTGAARTAGRVTAEVQHRAQQARDAFNEGRKR